MPLTLDNRTQAIVQVAVSITLYLVMRAAWRTQKTYPGFSRWTVSNLPNALGWLLISLRGLIPDWASVLVGNFAIFISPILLFAGIRQFRGKPARDSLNYALLILLCGGFVYFLWVQPSVNIRMLIINGCTLVVIARCALELFAGAPLAGAPLELRSSYLFTSAVFALYGVLLALRLLTVFTMPERANPFQADIWQSLLFMATIVLSIALTFGFFMMTNARLSLDLHNAQAELQIMAMTDFLTGAYNRRSFSAVGQRECARAQRNASPLGLLIIDIDHFKAINDTYGHLAGDEILCAIVAACRQHLRQVDLLARWGGEEFAVLLPETDRAGCQNVAEKLRQSVAQLTVPGGSEQAHITISIGGAMWTPEDEDLEALLRRADMALYQAKRRGRDCVVIP